MTAHHHSSTTPPRSRRTWSPVDNLSATGYLASPMVGAWTYNLAHTAPLPLALLAAGAEWHTKALTVAGAIGPVPIGLDRRLKYGVKYDHDSGTTHLGVHGRR